MWIATLISTLFEPMVMFILIALLGAVHAGLRPMQFVTFCIVLFGMVAPIVLFRMWYMRSHGADWDLSDRKKRVKPVLMQVAMTIAYTFFITWYFKNVYLTQLFVIFCVWILGFAIVTTQWKISGHASTLALATGLLILWYGWHWWPMLLVVPLVSWARVKRKDHTPMQVIVGSVYSWILLAVLARMFNV